MSLVNFITEHRYKSSLFRLNIKKDNERHKKPLMRRHTMSSSVFLRTFNFC